MKTLRCVVCGRERKATKVATIVVCENCWGGERRGDNPGNALEFKIILRSDGELLDDEYICWTEEARK